MPTLVLPAQLDGEPAYAFVQSLIDLGTSSEDVCLDFSKVEFAKPFASLVVGATIRRFRDGRAMSGYRTTYQPNGVSSSTRSAGTSYLAEMGFFDFIRIGEGKRVGQAKGSSSYVPITRIRSSELIGVGSGFSQAIEDKAKPLARVLAQNNDEAFHALTYCLVETIRNTFDHGHTEDCFFFAQSWSDSEAEIAVFDFGRGVERAMNDRYPELDADEALREALKPGVTSSPNTTADGSNDGYGLWMMSELGRRSGGRFILWSSNVRVTADKGSVNTSYAALPGTAVNVKVKTSGINYKQLMDRIRDDGDAQSGWASSKRKGSRSRSRYTFPDGAGLVFDFE